jgi:hypothetical protein
LVLDLFAFALAREHRLDDAAMVSACSACIRRARDVSPEVSEAELIARTGRYLEALEPARLAELVRVGETLSADDALRLALAPWGESPGKGPVAHQAS